MPKGSSWPSEGRWYDHSPRAGRPVIQSLGDLGSILTNKACGGDGIQLRYFKFWKKMLWVCCPPYASKFGRLSCSQRTANGQFSFQAQRKAIQRMSTQLLNCTHLTQSRRRQWQPTSVLLPGKSHGWRSLVGFSPWGREESDTTERLHIFFSLSCIGEGNGNPLHCPFLENPRNSRAWWAAVYGVAQSWTRLMRLSSSSNSTEWQRTAQNSPSQVSTDCEP